MVVRNSRPMLIRHFAAVLLVFMLMHCSGPATAIPLADLDYVEVQNHTGWILRIHGDGGGSLSHKQLPAHHLHYPAQDHRVPLRTGQLDRIDHGTSHWPNALRRGCGR